MYFAEDVNTTVLTLNAIIEKAWAEDYTDIQILTCIRSRCDYYGRLG